MTNILSPSMQNLTIVDSHCHLNFPELISRLDAVIETARQHGVQYCMTINTRLDQTAEVLHISEQYSNIFCTVGIHPNEARDHENDIGAVLVAQQNLLVKQLIQYANHPKVVGLGETGLDYYYENSERDLQKKSFCLHLEASEITGLPVVIHTRNADADTIELVKRYPKATGVFHCFSGDVDLAKQALDLGYYISFSGIITFKKADALREVVRYIPMDRILVETDSPYLAPIPHRGKSNEPAFTYFVVEQVSKLKDVGVDEVAKQTTDNYFRLFAKAVR